MSKTENKGYNVVFEGKGSRMGNYKGIRTWSTYESREDFVEKWENMDNPDTILAEGVTDEKAIEICSQTTLFDAANAAVRESLENDKINLKKLDYELAKIALSRRETNTPSNN